MLYCGLPTIPGGGPVEQAEGGRQKRTARAGPWFSAQAGVHESHALLSMNNPASLAHAKRWLVYAGTSVAGGLGLYGLGVWYSGNWRVIAYGPDTVPMSPGAALLLVLLSGAVTLRHRWAARPAVRALDFAVAES